MRLGILDVGSNSAHLRVVDAFPGSPPLSVFRHRAPTRLAESTDADGFIDGAGIERLVTAVRDVLESARAQQVAELIPFATAAVRDAANRDAVTAEVEAATGVALGFLTGEDEGRLAYFAAHRWYGWSAGPLLLLDIGGGSAEIVYGRDEDPEVAVSLREGVLLRRLSPLLSPDSLHQIELIQTAADRDTPSLARRRVAARAAY